jgi:hypothetical protein
VGTVTAGYEGSLAGVEASISALEPRDDTVALLLEPEEFRLPLDRPSGVAQPIDQQPFVLILRKDERVSVGADARAHVTEHRAGHLAPRGPHVRGSHFTPTHDDGIR